MPLAPYPYRYRPLDGGDPDPMSPVALTPPDDGSLPALNPSMSIADDYQTQSPIPPQPISLRAASNVMRLPTNGQSGVSQIPLPKLNGNGNGGGGSASYSGLKKLAAVMPPPGASAAPVAATAPTPAPTPVPEATPAIAPATPPAVPAPEPDVDLSAGGPASVPRPSEIAATNLKDIQQQVAQKIAQQPAGNWAQRLAGAVLAMTKLGPVANQIVHPKYSQQLANLQAQQAQGEEVLKSAVTTEQAQAQEEQRQAVAEWRQAQAKGEAEKEADRQAAAKQKDWEDQLKTITKGREDDTAYLNETDPQTEQLKQLGYQIIPNPTRDGQVVAVPPPFMKVTPDMQKYMFGRNVGDVVPWSEVAQARKNYAAQQLEMQKEAGKPPSAAQAQQDFQNTLTKVSAAGHLGPGELTDVGKLTKGINAAAASGAISQDEANRAMSYLATKQTPAGQTTAGVIRLEGLAQTREYPVINKNTSQMEMRSAAEINANPGTYAPAGVGAQAMGKDAIFQDIHYNINSARNAIQALDQLDAPTRAALSVMARDTDPRSAFQTFLTGSLGTQLNPQQQEAVQSLALLAENAMALRTVAGLGQGSEDLRNAIRQTIPSGKSPSKGYALGQLNKLEQVVGRLEKGVPGVINRPAGVAGGGTVAPIPLKDGTFLTPHNQAAADAFRKDHPDLIK
jgi:hypothetical protein